MITALLLLAPAAPLSAEETLASVEDFFADGPIILTASRLSKPMHESPASVSVIDREMIAASGARELADLLRLVPGFVVGYNLGHAPAVSYHGLGEEFGRRMQVLIDGRSVFIPSFGGVPWTNLPLLIQDIERIEIIRGPNAVTYGANAFLATINIITRHAAEDLGGHFEVVAGHNNETDIEDLYLRLGGQRNDLDWRLSAGTIADNGYRDINDSKSVGKVNFRLDWLARSNQFWTFQIGSSSSVLGRPESDINIDRDEDARNSYLNLQWEGAWERSTTIVRLTHTEQKVVDNFDPGPFTLGGVPGVTTFIDFDRRSERSDLEIVQTDDVADRVRLVYGAGARRDAVESLFLLGDDRSHPVDTSRLFGGVEWRPSDDWLLDLGVMFEDTSLTDAESSYRASLIRHLGERHALRLVSSTAKRNPILYEAEGKTEFVVDFPAPFATTITIPQWMGNPDIEPESILSVELGLHSRWRDGLESDIRLFDYDIDDMIEGDQNPGGNSGPPFFLPLPDVATSINEDSAEVRGIEFAVGYAPDRQFRLELGASVLSVESDDEEFEESFPRHTGFLLAIWRPAERHELSTTFHYTGEISWLDSQYTVPVARKVDLRYRYRLADRLDFEIVGQNLLDETVDYDKDKIHERLIYFGLSGGF